MIDLSQPNLDLGEVRIGIDTFFQVSVKNTYPEPKAVTIQPSCGSCTHFVSGPDYIAPGREETYKFRFNPTATGTQIKSIFFNIDGKLEATFIFKADVK